MSTMTDAQGIVRRALLTGVAAGGRPQAPTEETD